MNISYKKTNMGKKEIALIFHVTNKWNLTREDLEMANKRENLLEEVNLF